MSVAAGMPDPNDPRWKGGGFLREEALAEARRVVEVPGETDISKILLSMKIVGERELRQARAQSMGMAFADLDRLRPDAAAKASLPAALARELRALPVKCDGNTLWLAMDEPEMDRLQRVKEATGLRVIPVMCLPTALDHALEELG